MIKFLSLFLSFTMILTSVTPSFAQAVQSVASQKGKTGAVFSASQDDLSFSLSRAWNAAQQGDDLQMLHEKEIIKARAWQQTEDKYHWESCLHELPEFSKANRDKEEICRGGDCVSVQAYAQACIRRGVEEFSSYQGETLTEPAEDLTWLLRHYGVAPRDVNKLQTYFRNVLNKKDVCSVSFYIPHGSNSARADRRRKEELQGKQCRNASEALVGLAALPVSGASKKANADLIVGFTSKYYQKGFGAAVISYGVTSLMAMDTDYSYAQLRQFLLEDSVKAGLHKDSAWNWILDKLGYATFGGVADAGISVTNKVKGGDGRYLNAVSEKFQYLDKEEASAQGYKFTEWRGDRLQYPMGNVLEDLGRTIAMDNNPRSRALAKEIVKRMNSNDAYSQVHLPLGVGVLAGAANFKDVGGYYKTLQRLYAGDYYDLNEGTQRRLHNIAATAANKTSLRNPWKLQTSPDKDKQDRSIYNERIKDMSLFADAALMAMAVTSLVASMPSIARGSVALLRNMRNMGQVMKVNPGRLSAIRQAGKGELLAKVGASQQQAIKTAVQASVKPSKVPGVTNLKVNVKTAQTVMGKRMTSVARYAKKGAVPAAEPAAAAVAPSSVKAEVSAAQTESAVLSGKEAEAAADAKAIFAADDPSRASELLWQYNVKYGRTPAASVKAESVAPAAAAEPVISAPASSVPAPVRYRQVEVTNALGGKVMGWEPVASAESAVRQTFQTSGRVLKPAEKNFLFGKPYSELNAFQKWASDRFIDLAFLREQAGWAVRGVGNHPLLMGSSFTLSAGSMPAPMLKTAVQIEQTANLAGTSSFVVSDLAGAANTLSRTTGAVQNLSRVQNLSNTVSAANSFAGVNAAAAFSPVGSIVGVLNEFHGGASAKPTNMGEFNRGGSYLAAINQASLAAPVRTDFNAREEDASAVETVNPGEALGVQHQGKVIPMFVRGVLDKAAVAALIAAALQTGSGVLSVNGLGALTESINNSQYGKQINKALEDAREAAIKQYIAAYGVSSVKVEDVRFQTLFVKQATKNINGLDIPQAMKANILAGFTTYKPGLRALSEGLTEKWNLNATAASSLERALKKAFARAESEYISQVASPKMAAALPAERQSLYQQVLASELLSYVSRTRGITEDVKNSLLRDIGSSLDQNMDKLSLPSLERENLSVAVLPGTSLGSRLVAGPLGRILPAKWRASLKGEDRETVIRYVDKTFDSKTFTVAEGYNFISTKKQYPDKPEVAQEKSDFIASHILSLEFPTREQLVWIMASAAGENAKLDAYNRLVERGESAPTAKEVVDVHRGLRKNNTTEFRKLGSEEQLKLTRATERAMLEEENRMFLLPSSEQLLSLGADEGSFGKINKDLVARALYAEADVAPILSPIYKKTWLGNTHYENLLPVYVRDGNGHLTASPKLFLMLNGKGVTVPQGFSVALDEKGVFKFAPTSLRQINASRVPYNKFLFNNPFTSWAIPKFWKRSNSRYLFDAGPTARRLVFETPFKNAELNALNLQLLKDGSPRVAVLPLAKKDQFDRMMGILALIAGADTGASLSSQMKGTFAGTPFADSKSVGVSGFGYLSPLIANAFKPLVSHFGPYPALRAGFLMMAAVSAIGVGSGMWGYYSIGSGWSAVPMFAFFVTAISVASLFSTLASPVLKSAYPDKIVFASKNMAFTTQKGLSRLFVTALPAIIMASMPGSVGEWFVQQGWVEPVIRNGIAHAPSLNWSLVVPAVGLLSLWGYMALTRSRLHSEYVSKLKTAKEDASAQDKSHTSAWNKLKTQAQEIAGLYRVKTPEDAAMKKKFETEIAPALKGITSRLGKIYEAYAPINSVLMGLTAGMLYEKSTALLITSVGLFISWAIRKMSDKLLKSKIITDDQLTGLSLPLMSLGLLGLLIAPQDPLMILIPWAFMYISTPTFGVSENTRMMNFVASMYKQEREAIRNNESLSADEKTAKLDVLTHEEADMKLRVASLYNKNNAKGMLTIMGVIALLILFKDEPALANLTDGWAQTAANWMQPFSSTQLDPELVRAAMESKGLAVTPEALDAKTAENILSLSIFRLATILPAAISLILLWQNKSMIGQAITGIRHPRLTQEVIAEGQSDKILKQLQFNPQNIKTNSELIASETEEIYSKVKGYAGSLTSEKNLQTILNRLVWLNNRYKAFSENVPNGFESLSESLASFRFAVNGFQDLVAHNDVSEFLREQTDLLVSSVQGLKFDKDNDWASFPTDVSMLLSSSRKVSPVAHEILPKIAYSISVGDAERLEGYLKSLSAQLRKDGLVKENGKNKALLDRGTGILKDLKTQNYGVSSDAKLQYLPEGVTGGIDYENYESAKTISEELERIINDFNEKKFYDGMKKDFENYYKQAMKELKQYAKANRKHAASDENGNLLPFNEKRVDELEKKLDELYRGFIGDAPASAAKSK